MNFEKKLNNYKETMEIIPNEQNIKDTVTKSIDAFCIMEQERLLNYWEFLWVQLRMTRKRWWFVQFSVLLVLWIALPSLQNVQLMQRTLGIIASLFVILIIPELWKNKTYHSMEIEATSYYSLRQIYATRMLLFGFVDILLITLFCCLSFFMWNISFSQLVVQFILPMVVTSYICFSILCSKNQFNETFAILMCILWSATWTLIVLNESVYSSIAFPLWLTFLGIALTLLIITIHRTIYCCNNFLEVNSYGIDIR